MCHASSTTTAWRFLVVLTGIVTILGLATSGLAAPGAPAGAGAPAAPGAAAAPAEPAGKAEPPSPARAPTEGATGDPELDSPDPSEEADGTEGAVGAGEAVDPATELCFSRARLALAAGRREEALAHVSEALKDNPRHGPSLHLRGLLFVELGRLAEAERDLQALASQRPKDVDLLRLLGRVFADQGKWMWAARQLNAVVELRPKDGPAWLAFGYALYRLDERDAAEKVLQRAAELGPRAVMNQARVLLAILRHGEGRLREARHLSAGIRGPAEREAQELTRIIYAEEGRSGRGLNLSFRLGTSFDSNVSMDPVDLRGSGSRGWLVDMGAHLAWNAATWGRHSVGLGASLFRSFAMNWWEPGSCVSDYSLLSGSLSPWWAMRFTSGSIDHELRVGYRGQVITLDGSCQEDDSLYVFSERHAGTLGWTVTWTDRTSTHVSVETGASLFHHQVRDQAGAILEVGQSIFLLGRHMKLYPELHIRYEGARGDHWTLVAFRPSLALSTLLPGKLDLLSWVDLEVQRYPHSQGYIPWLLGPAEDRGDVILRFGVSLGRALTSWLRADLAYRYRWNRSNVETYDYQRHVVGVNLTAKVDLWKPGGQKDPHHKGK